MPALLGRPVGATLTGCEVVPELSLLVVFDPIPLLLRPPPRLVAG